MNSLYIKQKISTSIQQIRDVGIFKVIKSRSLTRAELQTYLANIYYILLQTAPCLVEASARAEQLGEIALAKHYRLKLQEESGHDRWCEDDLKKLLGADYVWSSKEVLPITRTLMDLQRKIIIVRPKCYLGYIALAEQLTVELGPEIINSLPKMAPQVTLASEEPAVTLSCISNHIELDKEHVSEGYIHMDEFIKTSEDLDKTIEHIEASTQFIKIFFTKVVDNDGRTVARVMEGH